MRVDSEDVAQLRYVFREFGDGVARTRDETGCARRAESQQAQARGSPTQRAPASPAAEGGVSSVAPAPAPAGLLTQDAAPAQHCCRASDPANVLSTEPVQALRSNGSLTLGEAAVHRTTRYGDFSIRTASNSQTGREHLVLVKGDVTTPEPVLCRIQSACVLSTALDGAYCDCQEQLALALGLVSARDRGIFLYLDEEGRGHGIETKVRALRHKNEGMDTFAAVAALGLAPDVRTYDDAIGILHVLGITGIDLITSNPGKVRALESAGLSVTVTPAYVDPRPETARDAAAKLRHGHWGPTR